MFWGFIFLAIGLSALAQQLGWIPESLDLFWSFIFIGLGLSIIFRKKNKHGWDCCGWFEDKKKKGDGKAL